MTRAIELAESAPGCLLPNPRVGAVIVRDHQIVGEGFHRGPGTPHAEIEAIRNAEQNGVTDFSDATLYLSLEPCCHTNKRTPPCVPVLIFKKFRKVVIAHLDPNPEVSGRGVQSLRKSQMEVDLGVLEEKAVHANQAFIKNQLAKLPYVTLKLAMTFDGQMADERGNSVWITGEEARREVHELRKKVDAVGVGRGTIEKDNPRLDARLDRESIRKKIVIFGKPKNLSRKLKVVTVNGPQNIYVIRSGKNLRPAERSLGFHWITSQVSLRKTLREIYVREGICHLLIEGGAELASSFLKEGLVDELVLYYGRGILGGSGRYRLGDQWTLKNLEKSIKFRPHEAKLVGGDVRVQGFFHVHRPNKIQG